MAQECLAKCPGAMSGWSGAPAGVERGGVREALDGIHLGVVEVGFLFPWTRERVTAGASSWELLSRPRENISPLADKQQEWESLGAHVCCWRRIHGGRKLLDAR